ncbi:hypothetical protein E8E15_004796 [Penicillium rubens]|nr:hypothetical protein E8E15_004796 [Penicillium rubens]KZN90206.1 hypothetical protein EN45_003200 [Penicillium chrysogenum]
MLILPSSAIRLVSAKKASRTGMDGQFAKMIPKRTEIDWRPQRPAGDRKARAGNALRFCLLNVEWEAGTPRKLFALETSVEVLGSTLLLRSGTKRGL